MDVLLALMCVSVGAFLGVAGAVATMSAYYRNMDVTKVWYRRALDTLCSELWKVGGYSSPEEMEKTTLVRTSPYKNLGKKTFSILVVCAFLAGPAYAGDVEAVYAVEKGGQRYLVTELLKQERVKISKWNALRLKRGERFWTYKLVDSEYPLRLSEADVKANWDMLKNVPDKRPFEVRHPIAGKAQDHCRKWGPCYNVMWGAVINGIQAANLAI
jgi:hypothetical protein